MPKKEKLAFDLGQQLAPQVNGHGQSASAEDANEVIFECLNRPFGHVAAVAAGGDKFVGHAGCLNGHFVLRLRLVVKYLMFGDDTAPAHPCQCTHAGEDEFAAGLVAHCFGPQRVAVNVV